MQILSSELPREEEQTDVCCSPDIFCPQQSHSTARVSFLAVLIRIKYPRLLFDDCWHHVALVLEVGWEAGGVPVAVYVDGVDVSSQGEANRVPAEAADGTLAVHSSTQVRSLPASLYRLV